MKDFPQSSKNILQSWKNVQQSHKKIIQSWKISYSLESIYCIAIWLHRIASCTLFSSLNLLISLIPFLNSSHECISQIKWLYLFLYFLDDSCSITLSLSLSPFLSASYTTTNKKGVKEKANAQSFKPTTLTNSTAST